MRHATSTLVRSLACLLVTASAAQAQIIGPQYPPPGGVTVNSVGEIGSVNGRTLTFSGIQTFPFTTLYWTTNPQAPMFVSLHGSPVGGSDYPQLQSFTSGVSATWGGTTSYRDPTTNIFYNLSTRLVVTSAFLQTASDLGNAPVINAKAALLAGGGSFSVNIRAEVNFGAWQPINSLQQSGTALTVSSFTGTFYYVPSCNSCGGDMNGDHARNGDDINCFVKCLLTGTSSCGPCGCADSNGDRVLTTADVPGFVNAILFGTGGC